MRLDGLGLLSIGGLALGFPQLLQQSDGGALDATAEFAAGASAEKLHEVLVAEVEQLVKVDAAVGILAESALLLLLLCISHAEQRLKAGWRGVV